jgi:NhaA family Na+:H+ antiporter
MKTIPSETNETFIKRFLRMESSGGILLILATVIALIFANTPLETIYGLLIA